MEKIAQYTLPNGLKIQLKEDHNAPIISHWVWYRVGSRDETPGKTGISHWVEHMQFKGTSRFPGGMLDKAISKEGGFWNAFTFLDWTAYFETMPANKIDLALELEADRMVNSLFDPQEVDSERTVIVSERQGSENEPVFRLGEKVQSTAFQVHNYHHEVIGEMDDLQNITRDDLYNHYRAYYSPNNAVVAVAGDFETDRMLEKLGALYNSIPSMPAPPHFSNPEPPQTEERRLVVEGPGETTYVQVAYKAPACSDPDFFPFVAMDSLLNGPSNLSVMGDGLSNKTSRLYRALVETELAVGVNGGLQATIDPFLFNLMAVVHPEGSPERVISALETEIQKLMDAPPRQEELWRAVKQARALFAYSNERITNQAFWLGFSEMIADYEWYKNYLSQLNAVTPEQVQMVANKYMQPQNRTLGIYQPTGKIVENEE